MYIIKEITCNMTRNKANNEKKKNNNLTKYIAEPCLERTSCNIDNSGPISLVLHPIWMPIVQT